MVLPVFGQELLLAVPLCHVVFEQALKKYQARIDMDTDGVCKNNGNLADCDSESLMCIAW